MSNNILSFSFHAYQAELYPTRIRALAVGFVYSWSRLSVVFSAFVIAFVLDRFGVPGVFTFIAGSMADRDPCDRTPRPAHQRASLSRRFRNKLLLGRRRRRHAGLAGITPFMRA